ncbi:transferase family protein [Penicillium hispanicum]|uniref:transferase family protein n=1 Tax=Penicillium hispanicum TaxID=1080232 RepID=UPI002541405A|nr:transferase family protein [Penicillium hispanicum]KAJ5587558.1 transferase family protein [Penicillium hispanicum]
MTSAVTHMHTERVFSRSHAHYTAETEKSELLSLLDATTAKYSVTGAVWFLERRSDSNITAAELTERLRDALITTLEAYPQWCGHLKAVPYQPDLGRAHHQRFGRLQLSYKSPHDPGVELVTAMSAQRLDKWIAEDKRIVDYRDMKKIPLEDFTPPTKLAAPFQDDKDTIHPCLVIQLTSLACGATMLGIKMAHPLGDAHTLLYFAGDWARISNAMATSSSLPSLEPLFQPSLLDKQAAGDIDKPEPDENIIKKATALPFHRYDWWAKLEDCPWPITPPEPFRSQPIKPAGKAMPWREWDVTAPVSHYVVHLSADQIQRVWEAASGPGTQRISRHDAVVVHIWSCINRARNIASNTDNDSVHCDLVYGIRERMSLGNNFLDSPIVMVNIEMKAAEASRPNLAPVASTIRSTLTQVQPEGLQAHLHSLAYEDTPQRLWQGFLGERHIIVTSWVQAPVYSLDFGSGVIPRYVEALMPDMDGTIQLKQAPPPKYETAQNGAARLRPWYQNGVDISFHVRSDVVENMLKDPYLFP